jgi:hypothetical protein
MITENQKEAICNILGKHYSSKVIAHLENKGIKPIKNKAFTPKIIQDIVNGRTEEYSFVEIEIVNLVSATKKRNEKAAKKLQNLL